MLTDKAEAAASNRQETTLLNEPKLRELYQRALDMNGNAFTGQEYDVAYHSLMAALHCAQRLSDTEYLAEVERVALVQLKYIDTHRPDYQHSTKSAEARRQFSIFETAARQARAKIHIIERAKPK